MENRDKDFASVMDDNEEHTAKQPNFSTCCLSVSHLSYSLNFVFSDSASSVLFIHQWIADISREQRKQSVTKAISRTMTEANLCFAMLLTEHSLRFAWQGHENNTTRDVCISQMGGEGALHCKQLETAGKSDWCLGRCVERSQIARCYLGKILSHNVQCTFCSSLGNSLTIITKIEVLL